MEFNATSFPLRDLLEAAEHLRRDRAVDLQGVRQYGLLRLDEATDSQLGQYPGRKWLRFYLPESYVPMLAPKLLFGQVRLVVYTLDQQRSVAVEVQIVACEATADDLQQQAPEVSPKFFKIQVSAAYGLSKSGLTLKCCLTDNFQKARTLVDLAIASSAGFGGQRAPKAILLQQQEPLVGDGRDKLPRKPRGGSSAMTLRRVAELLRILTRMGGQCHHAPRYGGIQQVGDEGLLQPRPPGRAPEILHREVDGHQRRPPLFNRGHAVRCSLRPVP